MTRGLPVVALVGYTNAVSGSVEVGTSDGKCVRGSFSTGRRQSLDRDTYSEEPKLEPFVLFCCQPMPKPLLDLTYTSRLLAYQLFFGGFCYCSGTTNVHRFFVLQLCCRQKEVTHCDYCDD